MNNLFKSFENWLTRGIFRRWVLRIGCVWVVAWLGLRLAVLLMPLPDAINKFPQISPQVADREGTPLRLLLTSDEYFLQPVTLEECAPIFIQATLAAEDKRFWSHDGVDWIGVARAVKDMIVEGRVVSGASTITQQLIKNTEPRPRTLQTKVLESLQAKKLEHQWTKAQILTAYLNRIDYGNLCRGAGTGARYYFDKPLSDVSPAEAAFLAGLPNAPARFNPRKNFDRAKRRQLTVLARMHRNGWLVGDAYLRACVEPIILHPEGRAYAAAHFVDLVKQQRVVDDDVKTTLDLSLNRLVRQTLRNRLDRLKGKDVSNGAAVVIENDTGNVLALVGSWDYFDSDAGQVNGAWARRSSGSTFKPFTYLLALESGRTPASVLADVPTDFATSTGVFSPKNFDHYFHGPVRMRLALANSLNVTAVKVLEQVGGAAALQKRLQECGITTLEAKPAHYGLGLTIGNAEVRLLELTSAFATLGRQGVHRPYRLLETDQQSMNRVFDANHAWLISDMLSDDDARTQAFGLDSALSFDFPVACKTGTSSEFRDNWAVGYTPEFTVGVWVGNFDGSPMRNVSGVTGAAPVMHSVMTYLHERFGTSWFRRPTDIVSVKIDRISGKQSRHGVSEWFEKGNLPPIETSGDRDTMGRVRLGGGYAEWFAGAANHLRQKVFISPLQPSQIKILSPLPGTVYYLDPDLPPSSRLVRLRITGGKAKWHSDTLNCLIEGDEPMIELEPGRHRLVVTCGERRLNTWIQVVEL
jgi:penicillin-binding protein 1C